MPSLLSPRVEASASGKVGVDFSVASLMKERGFPKRMRGGNKIKYASKLRLLRIFVVEAAACVAYWLFSGPRM